MYVLHACGCPSFFVGVVAVMATGFKLGSEHIVEILCHASFHLMLREDSRREKMERGRVLRVRDKVETSVTIFGVGCAIQRTFDGVVRAVALPAGYIVLV